MLLAPPTGHRVVQPCVSSSGLCHPEVAGCEAFFDSNVPVVVAAHMWHVLSSGVVPLEQSCCD